MAIKTITKEQAEAVLAEIKEKFASYITAGNYGEPWIAEGKGYSQMASYVIIWEHAPECWTQRYRTAIPGVFPDGINNSVLGLYVP